MKIKYKIKGISEFIVENVETPNNKDTNKSISNNIDVTISSSEDLRQEIDSILNKLQKLEVSLSGNIFQNGNSSLQESLDNELILEFTDSYNKGLAKGEQFGAAMGIVAVLVFLKVRANRRIKKKKEAYGKYWPTKQQLLIDKKYSDKKFDQDFKRKEFIEKELQGVKDKYDKKISKLEPNNPKSQKVADKLRADRQEKIKKLEEVINKKIDQKKERLKVDIDRKIEDMDLQWERDDADTNIASLFAKFSGNPAGGKMERKWKDWKLEFDRKVEDKIIDYERKLIDEIHGGDEKKLKQEIGQLDSRIKKFKGKQAEELKKSKEENAKLDQETKEFETEQATKEKAKEEKLGPEYIEAKQKYNEYMESVNKFGQVLSFAEKNTSGDASEKAKTDLQKAYKTMRMRSNFSKANAKQLMPDGDEKDYEELLKGRQEQLQGFKEAYNEVISKFKKQPAAQESKTVKFEKMVLTEKLYTYNSFMNESKTSEYVKRLSKKMKDFFKAVGKEGKQTKDAVKLVITAKQENRKLTDDEKEMVKEQLKDVLRTIGLSYVAVMPGGLLIAILLRAFEIEDKLIPSSFKK
tara:strand:- start:2147 stop:3883 length:1737 start_codon:yes stop_codon:yes gene_type:complete